MNGFCFPGRGGAFAKASMDSVSVAVNRHVCRSLGNALKRWLSSEVNVGAKSLSASSST